MFNYKRADFNGLNALITKSSSEFFAADPWQNSMEENWSAFKNAVTSGININLYLKDLPSLSLSFRPWINPQIKREMRKKDRLHKKAIHSKNQHHWKEFKRQRNYVSNLIKESHSRYLNDIIGESLRDNPSPKKLWSYVKHNKSENLAIPPLKSEHGLSFSDKDKAESLNSYFFSVFTNEEMPPPSVSTSPCLSISDLQISPEGVAKLLSQLNPKKACGPDELPSRVLKEIFHSASA